MRLALAIVLVIASVAPTAARTWHQVVPASGPVPEARRYAGAIHDPVANRVVVFGGQAATGELNDVWALDLGTSTWTELSADGGPAVRRTPTTIYDPEGHRMVTWSGQDGGIFYDDTWAFDLTDHTWSEFTPEGPVPGRRYGTVSVYDPVAATLVSFGGFTFQGRFDDTWRFDPGAGEWTQVSTPVAPLRRCLHSASYDSRDGRLILYGGQNQGPLDDLWALDLSTGAWTDLTPVDRPVGRFFTSHVYDPVTHRAVIFGGTRGNQGGITDELWAFDLDGGAWQALDADGSPGAREGAPAVHLPQEDAMLIFGGHDGTFLNDVWKLENLSGTATSAPAASVARARLLTPRPNPFNPSTEIRFVTADASPVAIDVYDVRGMRVRSLVRGARGSGERAVRWDGTDDAGRTVGSGVYLVQLRQADVRDTRRVTLVK